MSKAQPPEKSGAYLVQHSYEDSNGDEQTKVIGIYTTKKKAEETVAKLAVQPGFKDHPKEFYIDLYPFNFDYWATGFFHDDGSEESSPQSEAPGST